MKIFIYGLFFIFFCQSVSAGVNQMNCRGRIFSDSDLVALNLPATNEITEKTGIRFLALTSETPVEEYNEIFKPQYNTQQRDAFASTLASALKSFPVQFLKNNSDICFVFVDHFAMAAAVTSNNVVITASDVSLSIILHELMHATDFIHYSRSGENAWKELNQKWGCAYDPLTPKKPVSPGLASSDNCFASPYAKTDWLEDRAEVFSAMVMDYAGLAVKASVNPALNEKMESVKDFLFQIDNNMNGTYWLSRPRYLKREYYFSCNSQQSCAFDLSSYQHHADWN